MTAIVITAIVCVTLVVITLISNNKNKEDKE